MQDRSWLARVVADDKNKSIPNDETLFLAVGSESWFGIPIPVYVLVAVIIPLAFFMHRTVPGRYLYAIGDNEEAAVLSGIPVRKLSLIHI